MFRIGYGNDIHRLVPGRPLILGGVEIESPVGAEGHSDGDALTHAIVDALLGALALGDIGTHFSDQEAQWKDSDSLVFLRKTLDSIKSHGYQIANIDSTVSLQKPKLRPYIDEIRDKLAGVSEIDRGRISVKAKTGEGVDAVGTGVAIRADAVVLLESTFASDSR